MQGPKAWLFGARRPDDGCAEMSAEECIWRRAQVSQDVAAQGSKKAALTPEELEEARWQARDRWMAQLTGALSEGAQMPAVSEALEAWCADNPTALADDGASWRCSASIDLRSVGELATLQVAGSGEVVLTLLGLPRDRAQIELARAVLRWQPRCEDKGFEPVAIEQALDEAYHRCALPGGPLLVVGSTVEDLRSDLWQLSIALIAIGE